jgi:RNase P/RNase MRP subunit p30
MIDTTNLQQAKNEIKKSKPPITVQAQSLEFNRKILEYGNFQVILFPERGIQKKDRLKQLGTGINHVLAKIAAKNKIAIGINLPQIAKLDKKNKAIQLARLRQTIKTCRKANCEINLKAPNLLQSLGASSQQA